MEMSPEYWWLGIGVALIVAEVTMGNFILFFLGLAAVLTGVALWLGLPNDQGVPYLLYTALAVSLLVGLRARLRRHIVGDLAEDNVDEDFVGRRVTIISGFDEQSPGYGRVEYRGAGWAAESEQAHFSANSAALISSRRANTLIIKEESK